MHRLRHLAPSGVLVLSASILLAGASSIAHSQATTVRPLAYTRQVLPNGLVALFNEDHSSPIVGIGVWYHIGAKDEPKGHTGLAHLCEHMLFEGSPNVPPGQFQAIDSGRRRHVGELGRDERGPDALLRDRAEQPARDHAVARVGSHGGAVRGDGFDAAGCRARLDQERTSGESRESAVRLRPTTRRSPSLYGDEHPYRDPLGPMDELNRATFSEMRQFCTPYYIPNNAIVAISGDFDTAKAKAMVARYFGTIKRRREADASRDAARRSHERASRTYSKTRASRVARLRIAWAGAGFANPTSSRSTRSRRCCKEIARQDSPRRSSTTGSSRTS